MEENKNEVVETENTEVVEQKSEPSTGDLIAVGALFVLAGIGATTLVVKAKNGVSKFIDKCKKKKAEKEAVEAAETVDSSVEEADAVVED